MSEYMMETDEDYKREETSKQVYEFYSCNKLKYRKLCKEFDENEVEVDDNTTQDRYIKEREYGESYTLDQTTRKRKHEDKEKRKCEENVDELTKIFQSIALK